MPLRSTLIDRSRLALRAFRTNTLYATDGRDVLMNDPDGWEVEQPWLWWNGPAGSNGTGGPLGNPIPGAAPWTPYVGIPAVARASSLVIDPITSMPWHTYRGETERLPTPDWIADPQALRLDGRIVDASDVGSNDVRLSAVDFWGQWILSALWFGDGFIYTPSRDSTGAPKAPLWVLHPDDVDIEDGRYFVSDVELSPGSVIHMRGQLPIANGRGTGVLKRFATEFQSAMAMRDYASSAFSAGVPAGYLKTTSPNLTQDQADAVKSRWLSQHGNSKRSIAVLNATTEFHPLTWSPVDLAAVDFSRITLGQIALMFGVPAYMLGAPTDSNTYANVENRMLEFHTFTLLPWISRIEATLDAQLPRDTQMRVEVDGLLRADTATRYATYATALDKGILTLDEVRALENRPPLESEVVA